MSDSTSQPERLIGALDRLFEPNRTTLPRTQLNRLRGSLTRLREACASAEGNAKKRRDLLSATYRLWKDLKTHADPFRGDDAALISQLDAELEALDLRRVAVSKEMDAEVGDLVESLRGKRQREVISREPIRLPKGPEVRLQPTRDEPAGQRLQTFDGFAEGPVESPKYLGDARPEVVVSIAPFLDVACTYVTEKIVPRLEGSAKLLAEGVVASVRGGGEDLSPDDLCEAPAEPGIRVIEGLIEAHKAEDSIEILEQIQEFYRFIRRKGGPRGRDAALLRTADELERISGAEDGSRADPVRAAARSLREAVSESDYRRAAIVLGEVLRAAWGFDADEPDGERGRERRIVALCRETLRGPLGAAVIDDVESAKKESAERRSAFRVRYEVGPQEFEAYGSILRVLEPGVRYEHEYLLRPAVLASSGILNRVHKLLDRFEMEIEERADDRALLGARIDKARERAFRTDMKDGKGNRGLGIIFDMIAPVYDRMGEETRAWLDRELRVEHDAEMLTFEEGEVIRGLTAGEQPSSGTFRVQDWIRDDSEVGTVLRVIDVGLQATCLSRPRPAIVNLSRGPKPSDSLLERLARLEPPADPEIRRAIDEILQGSTDRRPVTEVAPSRAMAVAQAVMTLGDLLAATDTDVPGITVEDAREFLERSGFTGFPAPRALLTGEDIRGETERYEIEYTWDERSGAGRIVSVARVGWEFEGRIVRKAGIRVSLGSDPVLTRTVERVLAIARETTPPLVGAADKILRIYTETIEPRLGRPELLILGGADEIREQFGEPLVALLQAVEELREQVGDDASAAAELDRMLDQEFTNAMGAMGISVSPRLDRPVDTDDPELEVRRVFSSDVPEGHAVRILRRAVTEITESGDVGHLRSGLVEMSTGLPPEFVTWLERIRAVTEDLPTRALDGLMERVSGPEFVESIGKAEAYANLAPELLGVLGELDDLVPRLQGESEERARGLREALDGLVSSLAKVGVEIHPSGLGESVRLSEFSRYFTLEDDSIVYGPEATPVGKVLRVIRRALVVEGELVASGSVQVAGGAREPLAAMIRELGEVEPELAEVTSRSRAEVVAAQREDVVRTLSGAEDAPAPNRNMIKAALATVRALQDRVAPAEGGSDRAWQIGRALLAELEQRFAVRVLPGRNDDARLLRQEKEEGDRIETVFAGGGRGSLSVTHYGWRTPEDREPFGVTVSLGPRPEFLTAFEEIPVLGACAASGAGRPVDGWKRQVADVLDRLQAAGAPLDDTDGFVLPAFCEIYDIVSEHAADESLVSSMLSFLSGHFGVTTFPEPNTPLSSLSEGQYALGDIRISYEPGPPDLSIVSVGRAGLRIGERVLISPRFTVNRSRTTELVSIVTSGVLPVLEDLRTRAEGDAGLRVRALTEQLREFELLPESSRDSDQGRSRMIWLVLGLRRVVPRDWTVPGPDGPAPLKDVWLGLVERLGVRLPDGSVYDGASEALDRVRGLVGDLKGQGAVGERLAMVLESDLAMEFDSCIRAFEKVILGEAPELSRADQREYLIIGVNALHATLDQCLLEPELTPDLASPIQTVLTDLVQRFDTILLTDHKMISVPIKKDILRDKKLVDRVDSRPASDRRPWHADTSLIRPCIRDVEARSIYQTAVVRTFG